MRGLRVPIVTGLLFSVLWIAGSGATAQTNRKYPPVTPSVLPSQLTPVPSPSTPPSEQPTTPPSVEPSRRPREPLPFTGADLTRFVVVGVGLAGVGGAFVRLARRHRTDS